MPKFAFTIDQIADVAAFIHTFKAAGYDESRQKPPTILVGDAAAGKAFFAAKCASCHSAAGDLRGVASKITDEKLLRHSSPRRMFVRFPWRLPRRSPARAASRLPR